jgi:hypothetical protein
VLGSRVTHSPLAALIYTIKLLFGALTRDTARSSDFENLVVAYLIVRILHQKMIPIDILATHMRASTSVACTVTWIYPLAVEGDIYL